MYRPSVVGLAVAVLMHHFFNTNCDKIPNAGGEADLWHLNEVASKQDVYDHILKIMNKDNPDWKLLRDAPVRKKRGRRGIMADAEEEVLKRGRTAESGDCHRTRMLTQHKCIIDVPVHL